MENICYNCFQDSLNGMGICTFCGFDGAKNREKYPLALPLGSILFGRYIVGRVLGQGGFGITYLAQDYQTKGLVAIKEFFPDTMATRVEKTTVCPLSGERGEHFSYGLDSFLEEAQTMAAFIGNPNFTRVSCYFEENDTGYLVMEYLEGSSLLDYIKAHGGRISWEETMNVVLPVMDALSAMHEKGIIHRDVTPDNIFITNDGTVKLLDFGAARYSLGNVSRSLDVILKHGFAPKEQYSRRGRQGPYTDVYSLAATIYFALTGAKPDDAIERLEEDTMPLPTTLGAKITLGQEDALLKALAVLPADRFQSISEFRAALTGAQPEPEPWNLMARNCWEGFVSPQAVQVIQFHDTLREAPQNAADISAARDESVLAWLVGLTLHIGANGKIMANPNASYLFAYFVNLQEIHFNGCFDTANVTDMRFLFYNCKSLTQLDVSGLNTAKVQCMDNLFYGCESLTRLDVSGFDTANVTDMGAMFDGCQRLTSLNVSGFRTSRVTNMRWMFRNCRSLTNLDLSGFDTANVTDMEGMLLSCESLTDLKCADGRILAQYQKPEAKPKPEPEPEQRSDVLSPKKTLLVSGLSVLAMFCLVVLIVLETSHLHGTMGDGFLFPLVAIAAAAIPWLTTHSPLAGRLRRTKAGMIYLVALGAVILPGLIYPSFINLFIVKNFLYHLPYFIALVLSLALYLSWGVLLSLEMSGWKKRWLWMLILALGVLCGIISALHLGDIIYYMSSYAARYYRESMARKAWFFGMLSASLSMVATSSVLLYQSRKKKM